MELLVFLLPLLLGISACLLVAGHLGHPWLFVWMAPGIGIGLSSLLFFLWSLVFFPAFQPGLYILVEVFVLTALAVFLWKRRASFDLRLPRFRPEGLDWILGAACIGALFFFLYRFLLQTAQHPLGGWDAWALWNSRARYFLFGDASTWRNVFSVHVNQSDYPFLLSGFIARCWVLLGKDRTFVPILTAGLFSAATIPLLGAIVTHYRGLRSGLLAAFLLVSLPVFQWTCASQYADLPLAFYILGACVFVSLYFIEGQRAAHMILAGVFTGFALWTKNEGASFFLAVAASLVLSRLLRSAKRQSMSVVAFEFFVGVLPVLVLFIALKTLLVPSTDLFEDRQLPVILAQLTDLSRYQTIAGEVLRLFLTWGGWKIPYLPTLAGCVLLIGLAKTGEGEKMAWMVLSSMLAVTYLQYMVIYLITPHDIAWHMSTSVGRLYNQLLPALLLLLFLRMRSLKTGKPGMIETARGKSS